MAAVCSPSGDATDGTDETDEPDLPPCLDPPQGGAMLGLVAFLGEDEQAAGRREGEELHGRLALDRSALTQEELVVATKDFFVRTMAPASLPGPVG
ncbi:MAG: hypothetical protein ACI9MC_003815 [Kiritimatiellia bacterium]|jgi:hypothetical protein